MQNEQYNYKQQAKNERRHIEPDTKANTPRCPNCGRPYPGDAELCPHCMCRLSNDHCTYCGAPMMPGERFCGECGGNTAGIICPECGTRNFRSFCRGCGAPLDHLALAAIEQAKNDPQFQQIQKAAQQLAMLEEQIQALTDQQADDVVDFGAPVISESEREAVLRLRRLINPSAPMTHLSVETPVADSQPDESQSAINLTHDSLDLDALKREYANAVGRINKMLDDLMPDPTQTPQMQRNYFSARKVAVTVKEKRREPTAWICNYCGCRHNRPQECAKPELGGKWIYTVREVTVEKYV